MLYFYLILVVVATANGQSETPLAQIATNAAQAVANAAQTSNLISNLYPGLQNPLLQQGAFPSSLPPPGFQGLTNSIQPEVLSNLTPSQSLHPFSQPIVVEPTEQQQLLTNSLLSQGQAPGNSPYGQSLQSLLGNYPYQQFGPSSFGPRNPYYANQQSIHALRRSLESQYYGPSDFQGPINDIYGYQQSGYSPYESYGYSQGGLNPYGGYFDGYGLSRFSRASQDINPYGFNSGYGNFDGLNRFSRASQDIYPYILDRLSGSQFAPNERFNGPYSYSDGYEGLYNNGYGPYSNGVSQYGFDGYNRSPYGGLNRLARATFAKNTPIPVQARRGGNVIRATPFLTSSGTPAIVPSRWW